MDALCGEDPIPERVWREAYRAFMPRMIYEAGRVLERYASHATDVAHQTFENVLRKRSLRRLSNRHVASVLAFLATATRNNAHTFVRDRIRESKKLALYREELVSTERAYEVQETEEENPTERVRAAVEMLPPDQRDAIELRMRGLPNAEVAAALHISYAAAARRVSRGLESLRARLK